MTFAAVLFALAAVLGIVLLTRVVKGAERPLGLALVHGAFAAAGIVVLAIAATGDVPTLALWSLGIFVVAALGGFVLFGLDRTGRSLPVPLALVHGLAAVAAFLVLIAAIVGIG